MQTIKRQAIMGVNSLFIFHCDGITDADKNKQVDVIHELILLCETVKS